MARFWFASFALLVGAFGLTCCACSGRSENGAQTPDAGANDPSDAAAQTQDEDARDAMPMPPDGSSGEMDAASSEDDPPKPPQGDPESPPPVSELCKPVAGSGGGFIPAPSTDCDGRACGDKCDPCKNLTACKEDATKPYACNLVLQCVPVAE